MTNEKPIGKIEFSPAQKTPPSGGSGIQRIVNIKRPQPTNLEVAITKLDTILSWISRNENTASLIWVGKEYSKKMLIDDLREVRALLEKEDR